jgi:hypothetical protein
LRAHLCYTTVRSAVLYSIQQLELNCFECFGDTMSWNRGIMTG